MELELARPSPPQKKPAAHELPPTPRMPSRRPSTRETSQAVSPPRGTERLLRLDAPVAERPLESLVPRPALSLGEGEPAHGVTLHPGDGVVPPEVARAEEGERVRERVQGFAEDVLAQARAEGGINPYFEALGHALATELGRADGGSPVQLGVTDGSAGLKKSYAAAASTYGRTGDPGFPAPGREPALSERLSANDAPLGLRAMAQADETAQGLARLTPLLSLKLELRQTATGALVRARVLESSGSVLFDSFVLRVAPDALPKVDVQPPSRGSELRSVFQVDGWLRPRRSPVEQVARAFAPLALPFVDQLVITDPAQADFDYRAKLLRAY